MKIEARYQVEPAKNTFGAVKRNGNYRYFHVVDTKKNVVVGPRFQNERAARAFCADLNWEQKAGQ